MCETIPEYWQNLNVNFASYIKEKGVKPDEQGYYKTSFRKLAEFALKNGHAEYTPDVGATFFEKEENAGYRGVATISRRRQMLKRLNEHLYGCTMWHRANYGRHYKLKHPQCPEQFSEEFENFIKTLGKTGLKDVTVTMYRRLLTKMLCEFAAEGVGSWSDITAKHLTAAYIRSKSKYHFVPYVRRFFGYLSQAGFIAYNYSSILPPVVKPQCIPSVYSQDEIKQLLDSVDTNTPVGKRDCAILMIISGMGIRASDIAFMRFENVDFTKRTLDFTQYKTGVDQRLKLPIDVANAMLDYIENGREKSENPCIFLNGSSQSLSIDDVSSIVQRRFKDSKIEYGHRKHGANALRSSYASQLVEGNVPYRAAQVLMGHLRPETTRHYVKFAIESLRRCALEVPLPGGHFKSYLESEDDVLLRIF